MTRRDRIMLLVLATVALVGASWWFLVKPQRADLAAVTTELTAERDRLDAALAQATDARRARERFAADYAAVARLGKAVPADDDLASLLLQLEGAAAGARIDFRAVRVTGVTAAAAAPATTTGQVAAVGAAEQGGAPAAGTATASAPAGAPAAAAPATQVAAAGLPPGASIGPAGIATMPFTFTFEGSFLDMQRFLERVQRFIAAGDGRLSVRGRLLTIDGIGIGPAGAGFPRVKASLAATAYVLPAEQGLTAGATPQVPAPGAPAPSMSAAPATPIATATP